MLQAGPHTPKTHGPCPQTQCQISCSLGRLENFFALNLVTTNSVKLHFWAVYCGQTLGLLHLNTIGPLYRGYMMRPPLYYTLYPPKILSLTVPDFSDLLLSRLDILRIQNCLSKLTRRWIVGLTTSQPCGCSITLPSLPREIFSLDNSGVGSMWTMAPSLFSSRTPVEASRYIGEFFCGVSML